MKSISVVINARTQSSRVPSKLIRPFAGTSLIEIALAKLDKMDFFERRFLAVADEELVKLGQRFKNVEILLRDNEAVKKGVNPLEVTFAHYLRVPTDWVFVFNPCLPMMTIETIKSAYDHFQKTSHNSYTAVVPTGDWIFDSDGRALTNADPRNATTNLKRSFFKGCHAFHIHNKSFFRENGILWTFSPNDPHVIEIPEAEAVDVDTPHEFDLAEHIYRTNLPSNK
jgi:CMP-N-acetylneuraminic acid synthetase